MLKNGPLPHVGLLITIGANVDSVGEDDEKTSMMKWRKLLILAYVPTHHVTRLNGAGEIPH